MIVEVRNVLSRVLSATPAELTIVRSLLSFRVKGAEYTPQYQAGRWDGRCHLYREVTSTFPTGLLGLLKTRLTVQANDVRTRVEPIPADTSWLRDYQAEIVDKCLAAGRGIVHAATGAGKTEAMIALTVRVPGRWLILVHKKDLLHQTADRFELRTREACGRCGDGEWSPQRVTVATVQTLHRRAKEAATIALLKEADGVISDECHQASSDTYREVMNRCENAYWRFGFSGTPLDRSDMKDLILIGSTGGVVARVDAQSLVSRGLLAQPEISMVPLKQVTTGSTWMEVYRTGVTECGPRNALLARLAAGGRKPCLLFVREIAHGHALERAVRSLGVRTEFVWGKAPSSERQAAIKRLVRGDVDVLVTSAIFDEGVDIPEVEAVVVGSGGRSVIKTLQRLGRGMRVTGTKATMDLTDVLDQGHPWLRSQARARQKAYESHGFNVTVKAP